MSETERKAGRPGILGRWYAEPLDDDAARGLLNRADLRERRSLRQGRNCCTCRLLRLVAHFWLDHDAETAYRSAETACGRSAHGRALTSLIRGQLLASRRRAGAARQLRAGFEAAAGIFSPADYFAVVRRHALLENLPPSKNPVPPTALNELVTAAAVAARLARRVHRTPGAFDPSDTHG